MSKGRQAMSIWLEDDGHSPYRRMLAEMFSAAIKRSAASFAGRTGT